MSVSEIRKISDSTDQIETPFEGDFLGRKALADSLEGYVSRLQVGATIAIDAEWGAGKSWFVNHWKKQLENNDYKVIYLNAFSQDYIEDPFLKIAMEITNTLDIDKSKLDDIKSTIGNVYRAVLPNMPVLIFQVLMTLIGAGKISKELTDTFNEIKDDTGKFGETAAEILNEKLSEHISQQIDEYENEKKSLDFFKLKLSEITQKEKKPLVFIVDELDRCKPEFSVRLIERVKHFFDVPKVVFVLSMNKKQLEESINSYYGFSESNQYLDKFIDVTIILDKSDKQSIDFNRALVNFIENLGVSFNSTNNLKCVETLCYIFKPNPRQLVRILNKFAFLYNTKFKDGQKIFLFLVLLVFEKKGSNFRSIREFVDVLRSTCELYYSEGFKSYRSHYSLANGQPMNIFYYLKDQIFGDTVLSGFLKISEAVLRNKAEFKYENLFEYYPLVDENLIRDKDLFLAWYEHIFLISNSIQ
ncbi:KAP family P-loop NTPase fold protein [Acinetobacter baumannii]|uniref:KAP family P-loop NTPase fold protein n=1 Tax=Acinetobacter baumannii TaxID=470 RepID=UPI0022EB5AC1|nr:P-loop NTPase fold protein [Acinetobacter baumannii]MDA3432891.1 KAP family NTPase [Acinetobacter baumannii]